MTGQPNGLTDERIKDTFGSGLFSLIYNKFKEIEEKE
jgi:hypothetical protein